MTELSDKMIERLEDEFGATVRVPAVSAPGANDGELEFYSDYGEDFYMCFDPENAVEDITEQAENFDEDAHVLMWTHPQIDPDSLYHSLSDIEDAADTYLDTINDAITQIQDNRNAGWTDEQIKDWLESDDAPGVENGLRIDMDNGEIEYDDPALYRDIGTGEQMTVDEVMDAIRNEYDSYDLDSLICDEIGVTGTGKGAPSITGLIEDSQRIHKTLQEMADMLQEQRDLDRQECR